MRHWTFLNVGLPIEFQLQTFHISIRWRLPFCIIQLGQCMSVTPDGGDYNARVLIYSMFFISQKFGPRYGPKLYMIIIKRSDVAWNDSLCLTVWLSTLPPPLFVCVCVGSYFLSLVKLLLDFGSGQQRNGRNWHYWSSPPIPPPPSLKKEKKKEQYDPYKNINISQKQETWLWPFFSFFKLSNVKCTLLLGQDATEIEANFFFSNVILQRVKFPLAANHLMRSKGISNQLESKKDANKTKLYMMAIVRFDGHISRGD